MIYLINGTDENRTRTKYNSLIDSLLKKRQDASAFKVRRDEFSISQFEELIKGQTLFVSKFIVGCDHLSENKEALAYLEEHAKEIKESQNIFIFLETDDKLEKLFKKLAEKIETIDKKGNVVVANEFNIFSISDALLERDAQRMWVSFQKALRAGLEVEDVFFRNIVWIVRSMLAVRKTSKPEAMGVKPGTLAKIKRYSSRYSDQEVEELSSSLIDIHNKCRLGQSEFGLEIEKLIFSLNK